MTIYNNSLQTLVPVSDGDGKVLLKPNSITLSGRR